MLKILVSDKLSKEGMEVFKRVDGIEVHEKTGLPPEELKKIIAEYDGLAIRSATKVTKEIIQAASQLKAIGRAGIGIDNVDLDAATNRGIVVMNTPGENSITTAEHTISMLLALSRNIPQATQSIKEGKWEKDKFMGTEVFNKTLGILGIGNVGKIVANRALGLQMKVIVYDPYISLDTAQRMGVQLVSLDELYARSDYITIHVPLTKETEGMIDAQAIRKMKKGVRIINCARGGIIKEKDLYQAIIEGHVKGVALDVFEKEPPGDNPLLELDNVICTPHLGASTEEAQINVAVAIAEQMVDYLKEGVIRNAVNVPSISSELLKIFTPFINLAEKMGSLQGQLYAESIKEVKVEYSGEIFEEGIEALTFSFLKGLLTPMVGDNVNYVNAPLIAKERGIRITESKSSYSEDYTNLINSIVVTEKREHVVSGTIFRKNDLRIVRIDEYSMEAVPEGLLLILHNYDRPGVIGNVGTVLGRNNINISRMHLCLEKVKGKAMGVYNIDQRVSHEVIEEIRRLSNVISATQVEL